MIPKGESDSEASMGESDFSDLSGSESSAFEERTRKSTVVVESEEEPRSDGYDGYDGHGSRNEVVHLADMRTDVESVDSSVGETEEEEGEARTPERNRPSYR